MELVLIEDTKAKMVFELRGSGHTFCNGLKKELYSDSAVKEATYSIKHPLVGVPQFLLQTDGKKTPKAALKEAVERIKKRNNEFLKAYKAAI